MDSLKIYDSQTVSGYVSVREGEKKLGESVCLVSSLNDLAQCDARFVLLGVPEDIGVRANSGIGGAQTAWEPALKALLNMQENHFLKGGDILLLGHLEIENPAVQDLSSLRDKVADIDRLLFPVIEKIVAAGKIPVVIGGGHNNAYGIIRGVATALGQKIASINIDAHADLRAIEGRHSGNGFSYALRDNFLGQYGIFGLQQNYVNAALPAFMESRNIKAFYYEDLLKSELPTWENWKNFIGDFQVPCGLEIDLDSIAHVLSSACSPSGFLLDDIRRILLQTIGKFRYLHICEGAAQLADGRQDSTTGKTIAFLVSDFIKGNS